MNYSGFQGEVLVQILDLDFPKHSIHFHFSHREKSASFRETFSSKSPSRITPDKENS